MQRVPRRAWDSALGFVLGTGKGGCFPRVAGGQSAAHNGDMPSLVAPALACGSLRTRDQPVLATDELIVRPWKSTDRGAVLRAYADPEIQRWHARSMTDAEAADWIDSWAERWDLESGADWAVTDGREILGRIGLRRLDLHEGLGEVSFWVMPEARGRRVAPRALCALSGWASGVGFHRLELVHSIQNDASCRVARAASYELEGTKRQEALHPDGWHDMHLHARLCTD
jgi:ribosomal-protein-alanine N-acetyltransferase